jgi:hypothetical protein
MKTLSPVFLFAAGAFAIGALSANAQNSVTVIPRAAINDGSNASRAPFPQHRPFDDVKAPDGNAIDPESAPNSPATEPPVPPAPTVAVFQPTQPSSEATLAMTGRPTVGVATSLDATRVTASIRSQNETAREHLFTDIETRLNSSDNALREFRRSTSEMSATNRDQFQSAADDLKEKEKALKKSLKAARKASAQEWDSARAQLAADYEAYATAATRIDALAGIQPVVR